MSHLTMNIREKYSILPAEGGKREPFENEPEYFVLNNACPQEKLFKQIQKKILKEARRENQAPYL